MDSLGKDFAIVSIVFSEGNWDFRMEISPTGRAPSRALEPNQGNFSFQRPEAGDFVKIEPPYRSPDRRVVFVTEPSAVKEYLTLGHLWAIQGVNRKENRVAHLERLQAHLRTLQEGADLFRRQNPLPQGPSLWTNMGNWVNNRVNKGLDALALRLFPQRPRLKGRLKA
jgi:hypothetical protein